MDNYLPNDTIPKNASGGGGDITQIKYIKALDAVAKAISVLNDSIEKINADLQQTKQMLVNSHNIINSRMSVLQEGIMHYVPKAEIGFSMEMAEHCNLNCAGCDHFSPLAKQQFPDFEETTRDFIRLSKLFGNKVKYVQFAGGEPLLNPEITKFIVMANRIFPHSPIRIITNGVKLASMPEEFWNVCRDHNVILMPTKYPISVDYEAMQTKAKGYGVRYRYFNEGQTIKILFKLPLDFEGLQEGRLSFFYCHRANNCIFYQRGRLYTCALAAVIWRFDDYFGTKLFDAESNSIDIHKANSAEEVFEFLAKPIPFCRYCKIQNTVYNIPWHRSNKTIDEWT